jgi:putative protein-disulfide isomerase
MKVIYVYDALCGWCYGFSPVITEMKQKYHSQLDFEVLSGGMVTGNRIGPIGEVAGYIKTAYKDVERAAGVEFGAAFLNETLEEGTAIFTSVPPAIAMAVFKSHKPEEQVEFAAALQKAIYYEGKEPNELATYGELATAFGLDSATFTAEMKESKFQDLANKEFQTAARLGVRGFPTVFILKDGQYEQISHGYVPLSAFEKRITDYLEQ